MKPTSLRGRIALAIASLVADRSGGIGAVQAWRDDDDQWFSLEARHDCVVMHVGKSQVYTFALSTRVARKVAVWILWWAVCYSWLGIRSWLWQVSLTALYDAEVRRAAQEEARNAAEQHRRLAKP